MLQNESQTETPVLPGQVRVTPEELKRAIAAIEGRRQAEAQRMAGTIPIEEAVSSLHLDATHEEVWAEVQAQRDAAAREAAEAARRQQAAQAQPVAHQATGQASPVRGSRRPWRRLIAVGVVFSVLWGTGVFPHFGFPFSSGPTLVVSTSPTPVVTTSLAHIPDGTPFYCDSAALVQISKISDGKPSPHLRVAYSPSENTWSLIKMNGHVYLHAYSLSVESVASERGKPVIFGNDDDSGTLEGNRTNKTTLRIEGVPLQVSNGGDDYSEITVPNFQPDQFTTTSDWR